MFALFLPSVFQDVPHWKKKKMVLPTKEYKNTVQKNRHMISVLQLKVENLPILEWTISDKMKRIVTVTWRNQLFKS